MVDRSTTHPADPTAPAERTPHRPRRGTLAAISLTTLGCLALGGLAAAPVVAAEEESSGGARAGSAPADRGRGADRALRAGLADLVEEDGFPAALATVRGTDGRTRHYAAGVGDRETGARVPVDGQVRLGSNSKTFLAVVVLQLVAEGKVDLDASVETYLPGLVRGQGIDGTTITVRQLLQHTSGLPDYLEVTLAGGFTPIQDRYFQPRELLDQAMTLPATFAPGTSWSYSNTNYLVAGLLVEKVTGRPLNEQITERVIDRLGLRHTYAPATGERDLRERHPRGYHADTPGGELVDVTRLDPSWGWAAGELVGTPGDLLRFYSALLAGELLEPAQLAEMKTTVDAGPLPGSAYGLGLLSSELSCGVTVWGHGGDIHGYSTRNGVTEDGRRGVAIAMTALPESLPDPETAALNGIELVDTALCS